jgi:lactoylglutathione lyase
MTFKTEEYPGVCVEPGPITEGFVFNHSMLRVRDAMAALNFYTGLLGMRVLRKLDFPDMKFSLYFLAARSSAESAPDDTRDRTVWTFLQGAILELTHNWETSSDPEFRYHDGNTPPRGFGHLCFSVPDIQAAVAWFDRHEVPFVKRPDEGKLKDIAFIKDPDGYWIEIVEAAKLKYLGG